MFKWLFGTNEPEHTSVNGYLCKKVPIRQVVIGDKLSNGKRIKGTKFFSALGQASIYFEGEIYATTMDLKSYVWIVCEGDV